MVPPKSWRLSYAAFGGTTPPNLGRPPLGHVLAVAEDDDDGGTVNDDEFLAVQEQRDAIVGGVMGSWPC